MPLITGRENVLGVYADAARRGWTIPCFGSENLTTSEAVLDAAAAHAAALGVPDLPVTMAITCRYDHRRQAEHYTNTRNWALGLRLFLADLETLCGPGSPYARLRVMAHLDHGQHDLDREVLEEWDLSRWSSVMYDASTLPFAENIAATRRYVERRGREVVVEGACDEIVDAGSGGSQLTTPARGKAFLEGTGCDLAVANLGTEHRAGVADLTYHGDLARQVSAIVGPRLVLHGCSSVPLSQIGRLWEDGICKVNIWTALERDASPALLADLVANADKVAGSTAAELRTAGLLGPKAPVVGRPALTHCTTSHRQEVVFRSMRATALGFLELWYRNQSEVRSPKSEAQLAAAL